MREAEHRVQMIADHQTHLLPTTEAEFARLACLAGEDPQSYAERLESTFGSLGAVIVLLVWFYMSAVAVVVGAEIDAVLERGIASEPANPLVGLPED